MSKFNSLRSSLASANVWRPATAASPVTLSPQPVPTPQKLRAATLKDSRSNLFQSIGFWVFCTYMLSGHANDWALRLFGGKAFLSVAALLLLPFVWLLSGNALRGLRHPIGRWWLVFLVWLLLSTPLSIWKGGTVDLLKNYIPRSYLIFFYISAFVISLRQCRCLTYVNIAAATILLLTCLFFGGYSGDGRFEVPGSLVGNSNELALQLLLGVTQFAFLFFTKGFGKKAFATLGIGLSVVFMLRTGSRGCMIAAVAYGVLTLVVSRHKVRVLILAVLIAATALISLPSVTMRRLTDLGFDDDYQNLADGTAAGSRMQRIELLKRSVQETMQHPLFGVGPRQFPVAVAGEQEKKGEWANWLGTHNSYTQVSSECGVPALLFYTIVIALCLRMNYRLLAVTKRNPAHAEIAGLAATVLAGTVVYAVCTFFFHMAYTGNLPSVAGLTLALHFAANEALRSEPAASQPVKPGAR